MATQTMGLIGEIRASQTPKFLYDLISPDFSRRPKRPGNPFSGLNNYPSATALFHQRRIYVSTNNKPSSIFASAIAAYNDFSETGFEDGPFILELDSQFFDPVNHIIASQFGVFLFSERGVHYLVSNTGGGITESSAVSKGELSSGSKRDLAPLRVLNNVVFISNLDNTPRALEPVNTTPNQFGTQDLALYSQHFFGVANAFIENPDIASSFNPLHRAGAEIISWTYAGRPGRVIWAVRADGLLLSCTYAPEHGVNAWCKHTTKGRFRAVQSVYEKNADTVYLVTERGDHKFIECLGKLEPTRLENSVPFDAAVRTQNFEPNTVTVLYLDNYVNGRRQGTEDSRQTQDIIGFTRYTGLGGTIEGSGISFTSPQDVGDSIRTPEGLYRITAVRSPTQVELEKISELPWEQDDGSYFVHGTEGAHYHPIYQWEIVDQVRVFNAFHLHNQEIHSIEGTDMYTDALERGNGIIQNRKATVDRGLVAGLPFKSSFESLPFIAAEGVLEDKPKRAFRVSLRMSKSSSVMAGTANSAYPLFFDERGEPETQFKSGTFQVDIGADWETDDPICVESKLPFFALGIVVSFDYGDEPNQRTGLRGAPAVTL